MTLESCHIEISFHSLLNLGTGSYFDYLIISPSSHSVFWGMGLACQAADLVLFINTIFLTALSLCVSVIKSIHVVLGRLFCSCSTCSPKVIGIVIWAWISAPASTLFAASAGQLHKWNSFSWWWSRADLSVLMDFQLQLPDSMTGLSSNEFFFQTNVVLLREN